MSRHTHLSETDPSFHSKQRPTGEIIRRVWGKSPPPAGSETGAPGGGVQMRPELTTVNGEHNVVLKDGKGHIANISTYDVIQSNGVIHVIDSVVMP